MIWKLLSCNKETCDPNIVIVTITLLNVGKGFEHLRNYEFIEKFSGLNLLRVSVKWAIEDSVTQNTSAPKVNYFQKQNWRVSWRADHCTSSATHYFQQLRASYWKTNELLQDSLKNCFIMRISGHKMSMMSFFFCD